MEKFLLGLLEDVKEFHLKVTGMPMPFSPQMLTGERRLKRGEFLDEELQEFGDATSTADQADALVDLIYVALGGLLEMGIHPGEAFKLVHDANMKKVGGANKRGSQYEAAKPAEWKAPDWGTHLNDRGVYRGLKPRKKILLLGYGRHGKDTVAEILRDTRGYRFTSSSFTCAEHVMLPYFKTLGEEWAARVEVEGTTAVPGRPPFYANSKECFEDRHNHRATWFQEIERFNSPDKSKLGQLIFSQNDIYVGLRSKREFAAVKNAGLYDVCVWVDATDRLPAEDRSSCTVEPWMADYVLDNNGSLEELKFNLDQLMESIS